MVEWLAGNRLRGTTAERPALGLPSGSVGGWVEVGRTTLGSSGSTISVTSLPDKRYYKILANTYDASGTANAYFRLNNDSGSNYAYRRSVSGASDTTATSTSTPYIAHDEDFFNVMYLSNLSSKEKLLISHHVNAPTAGASNILARDEVVAKWANTSSAVNRIDLITGASFTSGSEVVVLGWDPTDNHTTNFWEQIGTGTGTGVEDVTASASKKYNWIQGWVNPTSGSTSMNFQLGNGSLDTGTNYAWRYSLNGAGDVTATSDDNCILYGTGASTDIHLFYNIFFINNSANEKLIMINNVYYDTAGAGSAPIRFEIVGKWANTSAQANHAGIVFSAGNAASNSELRWWGAD